MLKRRYLLMAAAGGLTLLAAMRYRMPSSEAADERFPVDVTSGAYEMGVNYIIYGMTH